MSQSESQQQQTYFNIQTLMPTKSNASQKKPHQQIIQLDASGQLSIEQEIQLMEDKNQNTIHPDKNKNSNQINKNNPQTKNIIKPILNSNKSIQNMPQKIPKSIPSKFALRPALLQHIDKINQMYLQEKTPLQIQRALKEPTLLQIKCILKQKISTFLNVIFQTSNCYTQEHIQKIKPQTDKKIQRISQELIEPLSTQFIDVLRFKNFLKLMRYHKQGRISQKINDQCNSFFKLFFMKMRFEGLTHTQGNTVEIHQPVHKDNENFYETKDLSSDEESEARKGKGKTKNEQYQIRSPYTNSKKKSKYNYPKQQIVSEKMMDSAAQDLLKDFRSKNLPTLISQERIRSDAPGNNQHQNINDLQKKPDTMGKSTQNQTQKQIIIEWNFQMETTLIRLISQSLVTKQKTSKIIKKISSIFSQKYITVTEQSLGLHKIQQKLASIYSICCQKFVRRIKFLTFSQTVDSKDDTQDKNKNAFINSLSQIIEKVSKQQLPGRNKSRVQIQMRNMNNGQTKNEQLFNTRIRQKLKALDMKQVYFSGYQKAIFQLQWQFVLQFIQDYYFSHIQDFKTEYILNTVRKLFHLQQNILKNKQSLLRLNKNKGNCESEESDSDENKNNKKNDEQYLQYLPKSSFSMTLSKISKNNDYKEDNKLLNYQNGKNPLLAQNKDDLIIKENAQKKVNNDLKRKNDQKVLNSYKRESNAKRIVQVDQNSDKNKSLSKDIKMFQNKSNISKKPTNSVNKTYQQENNKKILINVPPTGLNKTKTVQKDEQNYQQIIIQQQGGYDQLENQQHMPKRTNSKQQQTKTTLSEYEKIHKKIKLNQNILYNTLQKSQLQDKNQNKFHRVQNSIKKINGPSNLQQKLTINTTFQPLKKQCTQQRNIEKNTKNSINIKNQQKYSISKDGQYQRIQQDESSKNIKKYRDINMNKQKQISQIIEQKQQGEEFDEIYQLSDPAIDYLSEQNRRLIDKQVQEQIYQTYQIPQRQNNLKLNQRQRSNNKKTKTNAKQGKIIESYEENKLIKQENVQNFDKYIQDQEYEEIIKQQGCSLQEGQGFCSSNSKYQMEQILKSIQQQLKNRTSQQQNYNLYQKRTSQRQNNQQQNNQQCNQNNEQQNIEYNNEQNQNNEQNGQISLQDEYSILYIDKSIQKMIPQMIQKLKNHNYTSQNDNQYQSQRDQPQTEQPQRDLVSREQQQYQQYSFNQSPVLSSTEQHELIKSQIKKINLFNSYPSHHQQDSIPEQQATHQQINKKDQSYTHQQKQNNLKLKPKSNPRNKPNPTPTPKPRTRSRQLEMLLHAKLKAKQTQQNQNQSYQSQNKKIIKQNHSKPNQKIKTPSSKNNPQKISIQSENLTKKNTKNKK